MQSGRPARAEGGRGLARPCSLASHGTAGASIAPGARPQGRLGAVPAHATDAPTALLLLIPDYSEARTLCGP